MNNQKEGFSMWAKYEWAILMVVVLLGFAMRLYGINLPLIESHQARQAQTAVMARNLYEDNMDIFHTRLDFFGQTPGYVILEFPLMHAITALLYYLFGAHEIIGRLVSVVFSVGAMFLMYGLARQFLSVVGALAALILYAFSPMNIFFSRAFMPESSMMFFMIGAVYFFLRWLDKKFLVLYLTAIIFAAFACLAKPTAALIFAPILAAWFLKDKWGLFKRFDFWLYILLAVTPGILWAAYANYFNSTLSYGTGGFSDSWIEILRTRGIIRHWFSPKFYGFVGGSIIFLLLTPLGFIGTAAGVFCVKKGDRGKILCAWLAAIIIYFYLLAGPNSGHIYYHLHLLPLAVIFFGYAVEWPLGKRSFIKEMFKRKLFIWLGAGLVLLILVGYGIGYFKYFKYMYSNRMPYVLEVSEMIKKNAPGNRLIIDNGSGHLTSVISYYSHSKVQPFGMSGSVIAELERLRTLGATTFVTMETAYGNSIQATKGDKGFWNYLNENYKAIAITEHYLIFDLRNSIR
ncbi:MAG: glycosyltransferase family 39 protein [Candidatus Omnitrophica bacterium]|nr:glycosyltransferase family 39 protein [Candidatus Omnitrophota bacterium]